MNYERLIGILSKTNNPTKLLNDINKLSAKDKLIVLSSEKLRRKILSLKDVGLLVNILIDLPADFRINFLSTVNLEEYKQEYERVIIEFLRLEDYNTFNHKGLASFTDLKDKQILATMLKKISSPILKDIIIANYTKTVNNYAFLEYSRKEPDFELEAQIMNNVNNEILFLEIKKRKLKGRSTILNINEFIQLDGEKQKGLLINGDFKHLESEIMNAYQERNKSLSTEELCNEFNKALETFNYIKLVELQTIICSVDDITAEKLMRAFFKQILHFDFEVEPKYLKTMAYAFRRLSESTSDIYALTKTNNYEIINYLNTGAIDKDVKKTFEGKITCCQYQKTNTKRINKIIKLCSEKFPYDDVVLLCYKMYYILGYDNTIELLNGKFGPVYNIRTLEKIFECCDVTKVQFKKVNNSNEPCTDDNLIQFLIGDKKDDNTTIKRMLRGEIVLLVDEFPTLYNNLARIQGNIGTKLHLNKVLSVLKENPYHLLPNEYKFTKDIIADIINSFEVQNKDDAPRSNDYTKEREGYVKKACEFYHNYLENRLVSTIPRVVGKTEDGYSYEVLKLNDPLILTLGYKTGCCFRLDGQSKEFLQYCSESPYARVIVIRNEYNEICSMIPIIRNGNVVAGNSIESNSKGANEKIYAALKEAFDDIIRISFEHEEDPIIAGLVTNLHNNCYSTTACKSVPLIRDKDFYTNYDKKTFIVSRQREKTFKDFRFFHPRTLYYDERPPIIITSHNASNLTEKDEAENRINAIKYKINRNDEYEWFYLHTICSEDWYIRISGFRNDCDIIDNDPRAKQEVEIIQEYLNQKYGNARFRGWLDDDDVKEITKPKKLEYTMQFKKNA